MAEPVSPLISLIPLILFLSPIAIWQIVQYRRKRNLTDLLKLSFETFCKHLDNNRPDSARGVLRDLEAEFSNWAKWKLPLLTRFGRFFLEETKNWLEVAPGRDRFRWAVAVGEMVAALAPRLAELQYREVQFDTYHYLYQSGLKMLPFFPDLQVEVLRLGRIMGALGREAAAVTIYDEMAIANDIRAHLALVSGPGRSPSHQIQSAARPGSGGS